MKKYVPIVCLWSHGDLFFAFLVVPWITKGWLILSPCGVDLSVSVFGPPPPWLVRLRLIEVNIFVNGTWPHVFQLILAKMAAKVPKWSVMSSLPVLMTCGSESLPDLTNIRVHTNQNYRGTKCNDFSTEGYGQVGQNRGQISHTASLCQPFMVNKECSWGKKLFCFLMFQAILKICFGTPPPPCEQTQDPERPQFKDHLWHRKQFSHLTGSVSKWLPKVQNDPILSSKF